MDEIARTPTLASASLAWPSLPTRGREKNHGAAFTIPPLDGEGGSPKANRVG